METGDSSGSSAIKAVSSTNQLVTMKSRLQAGLSARLLELKAEMDKEFGMAFVDMESYLRTEKGELPGFFALLPVFFKLVLFWVSGKPIKLPIFGLRSTVFLVFLDPWFLVCRLWCLICDSWFLIPEFFS